MSRCLVTLAAVVAITWLMSHRQQAQGQREVFAIDSTGTTWVRTVDGWEPSHVLKAPSQPASPPSLHPLLVAGFELSASLLALLAFPETCGAVESRAFSGRRKAANPRG